MITIFLFLTLGMATGVLLRRYPNITFIGKLIAIAIVVLLFLLGNSVGRNEAIINNLWSIGMQALIITSAAIAGSVLMSVLIYKYFFKAKKAGATSGKLSKKPI